MTKTPSAKSQLLMVVVAYGDVDYGLGGRATLLGRDRAPTVDAEATQCLSRTGSQLAALPRSARSGPFADGRTSKSKIAVGR